jgi:hypothetical protein
VTAFSEWFRGIATDFIQNVVVVDDEAFMGGRGAEAAVHRVLDARTPVAAPAAVEDDTEPAPNLGAPLVEPAADPGEALMDQDAVEGNDLDAKEVIDEFAKMGIFCSIVVPPKDGAAPTQLIKRADITIFDWWLHGDYGARVLDMIKGALRADRFQRVRLIGIYTGKSSEEELLHIVAAVKGAIAEVDGTVALLQPDPFTIVAQAFRVVVYGKRHAGTPTTGFEERLKSWREMPNQMVKDFASLCEGIVPAVVLRSLSKIRDHSWSLLKSLDASLDAAYLWHRAAQCHPSDAEEQLLAVVAAEIESILLDSDAASMAGIETIKLWLDQHQNVNWKSRFGTEVNKPFDTASVFELLRVGVAKETEESHKLVRELPISAKRRDSRKPFFWSEPAFAASSPEMNDRNILFAERMSLKTLYSTSARKLHLGTILARGTNDERRYWVSLQPLCDSERIKKDRRFPLSPLKVRADDSQPIHFIVRDGASVVRLALDLAPYLVEMVKFSSTQEREAVIARQRDNGTYYFQAEGNLQYDWIAELKPSHAARIAQIFSDRIGRVGLDESEWLRHLGR